ncbi:MAG TPA: response regulator transcription factor [Azospirillaceae bacterium]|nr:response regulator transcription factor [Azospirillaceae bacterium]
MNELGVLVVDPCSLFRAGIRRILPPDFHIVAEASNVGAALARLGDPAHHRPAAIVLLDTGNAQDLKSELHLLAAALPDARVIHLTGTPSAERLLAVVEEGGHGCLSKDRSPEALGEAMRLVAMGEKVFPSDLLALLEGAGRSAAAVRRPNGLSGREMQILRALLLGESNKAIGNALGISEATVKVHLKSLMRKLNVANRTQAAIWAMNQGITADALGEVPAAA